MILRLLLASLLLTLTAPAEKLKVASLHPLLTHLSREIGGPDVETIDLVGANGDPHKFEPDADDIRRAAGARLYLASGMGLESYLPRLRGIIGKEASLLEVGATLPALEGACSHEDGHQHHSHGPDPHWWHSIDLFRRATTVVSTEFSRLMPSGESAFQQRAEAYRTRLDDLEKWARREVVRVPRSSRHLATAHAAFNYFCKDFGFQAHPVQGLNREQIPSPDALAALVDTLRAASVTAVFPETNSNPKILDALTRDSGIALGPPLNADGTGAASYEEMMRANVTAIVRTLGK